MVLRNGNTLANWGVAALFALLLAPGTALAQGAVTPSFDDGQLVLLGEGYRPGERVEIAVGAGSASHQFTTTADRRGHFRLETGLQVPPLSSVQVEARDEQGLIQATITSAPASSSGTGGGMPLPPAPDTDAPPPAGPDSPDNPPCST